MLRQAENVPSVRTHTKPGSEIKGTTRSRLNALGDVQNIVHARSTNFGNVNANSAKKPNNTSLKPSTDVLKSATKIQSNSKENVHHATNSDSGPFQIHNHLICEQAEEECDNNFLQEYRLSEKQINTLTKSVKQFGLNMPRIYVPLELPCEDIIIKEKDTEKDDIFCMSDIMNDCIIPEVSSLIEML